jgi:hypothetical protein
LFLDPSYAPKAPFCFLSSLFRWHAPLNVVGCALIDMEAHLLGNFVVELLGTPESLKPAQKGL